MLTIQTASKMPLCRCGFEINEKNKENHNYCSLIPDETVALLTVYRRALEHIAGEEGATAVGAVAEKALSGRF